MPVAEARRYAAIVIDADTGKVLHQYRSETRNYPASLTKIMTLYMVFDAMKAGKLSPNQRLKVSRKAAAQPPSKLGLRAGQTIRLKHAILALVTKSANDVAVVIAEAMGGSEKKFAQMMTKKAKKLGLHKTTFKNASGLPNNMQKSTARDMARLGQRIIKDFPQYFDYFSTKSFRYKGRTYRNHNKLLSSYNGTDGIKTGFINASGFNLVASVKRNNRRLIGVVFGGRTGKSRDLQMKKLLNRAFRLVELADVRPKLRPNNGSNMRQGDPQVVKLAAQTLPQKSNQSGSALTNQTLSRMVAAIRNKNNRNSPKSLQNSTATSSAKRSNQTALQGPWAIQVGAFKAKFRAHNIALSAAQKLGNFAQFAQVSVIRERQKRRLYKARIIGFSKEAAMQGCAHLKYHKIACIPIKLKQNTAQLPTQNRTSNF